MHCFTYVFINFVFTSCFIDCDLCVLFRGSNKGIHLTCTNDLFFQLITARIASIFNISSFNSQTDRTQYDYMISNYKCHSV